MNEALKAVNSKFILQLKEVRFRDYLNLIIMILLRNHLTIAKKIEDTIKTRDNPAEVSKIIQSSNFF